MTLFFRILRFNYLERKQEDGDAHGVCRQYIISFSCQANEMRSLWDVDQNSKEQLASLCNIPCTAGWDLEETDISISALHPVS